MAETSTLPAATQSPNQLVPALSNVDLLPVPISPAPSGAELHPDAPVSPGAPAEALNPHEELAYLHMCIYGGDNGVPTIVNYRAAQRFAGQVHWNPDRTWIDGTGHPREGAYVTASGTFLADQDAAQDVVYAASPNNWIQSSGNRDVLRAARRVLQGSEDFGQNAPLLERAEVLAGRVAEDAAAIDADALQRMIALDAVGRTDIIAQYGEKEGRRIIAEEAAYTATWAGHVAPAETAQGHYAPAPGVSIEPTDPGRTGKRVIDIDLPPRQNTSDVENTAARAAETAPVSPQPTAETVRPQNPELPARIEATDGEILTNLISDPDVQTLEHVAIVLNARKLLRGSQVYGRKIWTDNRESVNVKVLASLTEAELAEAEQFYGQLVVARSLEADVPYDFLDGRPLPTIPELAAELYPGLELTTEGSYGLSGDQMTAVIALRERLRAARLEQVRPDTYAGLRMKAEILRDRWNSVRRRTASAWEAAKEKTVAARETTPGAWQNVKDRASAARNRAAAELTPDALRERMDAIKANLTKEQIRERVSLALGAAALTGAAVIENKPWQRVMPALREISSRLETSEFALKIAMKVQELAAAAVTKTTTYLAERLAAARQMERNEIAWRAAGIAAAAAVISATAIRQYLQARHGIDGGDGMGHALKSAVDTLPTNHSTNSPLDNMNVGGTGSNSGLGVNEDYNALTQVGSYDSHIKIMGYPKGTVGYRVLEHAQASGIDIHDKTQADRLIGETLKMDHMGWTEKVADDQQIKLLSVDQMHGLLQPA